MPRVKCPRCSNLVDYTPPAKPVCGKCGYGATPATTVPPSPQMQAPTFTQAQSYQIAPPAMGRPGLVTAVAIIDFVIAGAAALGGLVVVLLGQVFAAFFNNYFAALGALGAAFFAVIGVIIIAFGVLYFFVGLHVLKGKMWARIAQIVLASLSILSGITSAIRSPGNGILSLALAVFILVAMLLKPTSDWFKAMAPRPAA